MEIFLLPLTNIPQEFNINLNGRELIVICKWNDMPDGGWVVDLLDFITNESIIAGIPLVSGADLLDQYEYLELGGGLVVFTDGDQNAVPTLENLGIESNVYYITEGEA